MVSINIDMPESCDECPLKFLTYYKGRPLCGITKKQIINPDKREGCPLTSNDDVLYEFDKTEEMRMAKPYETDEDCLKDIKKLIGLWADHPPIKVEGRFYYGILNTATRIAQEALNERNEAVWKLTMFEMMKNKED